MLDSPKTGRWPDNSGRDSQTREVPEVHREHGLNRGSVRDPVPAQVARALPWQWSLHHIISSVRLGRLNFLNRPRRGLTATQNPTPEPREEEHPEPS